jgi:hypothetical protein
MDRLKLGIQGPVVAWQDPWAGPASDRIMRTGTGTVIPSQEPCPGGRELLDALARMGADFYVHHLVPGVDNQALWEDLAATGLECCLGNEYGNINGPWTEGTNRYDPPAELIAPASGACIGVLYDEPEHLQGNADQYRRDVWLPHWALTDGLSLADARLAVEHAARARVGAYRSLGEFPVVSEQVFPTMVHTLARAGMTPCPKVMKESFQSLALATALGAAKQYGRALWICADLWGPDAGPWFTRLPGFPGHSPAELASALRMAYLFAPDRLFVENVDALLRNGPSGLAATEFGAVVETFARGFAPSHPLSWCHGDARPDVAVVASDDGYYGGKARPFGNRLQEPDRRMTSVFEIWHLLSGGRIPAHGSCMHIPGYDFPRHQLKAEVPPGLFPLPDGWVQGPPQMHPLHYPLANVVAYDGYARSQDLEGASLIVAGGSSVSPETLEAIKDRVRDGATAVVARWLAAGPAPRGGTWVVVDSFLEPAAREAAERHVPRDGIWRQRFGDTELRLSARDAQGFELDIEIAPV